MHFTQVDVVTPPLSQHDNTLFSFVSRARHVSFLRNYAAVSMSPLYVCTFLSRWRVVSKNAVSFLITYVLVSVRMRVWKTSDTMLPMCHLNRIVSRILEQPVVVVVYILYKINCSVAAFQFLWFFCYVLKYFFQLYNHNLLIILHSFSLLEYVWARSCYNFITVISYPLWILVVDLYFTYIAWRY